GSVGRTPTIRGELLAGAGFEGLAEGLVAVGGTPIALGAMQYELASLAALEDGIQPLDLLQDRRIGAPYVLEVHGPLDGRILSIFYRRAPHFQSGMRISPGNGVLSPVLVEGRLLRMLRHGSQKGSRGLPIVDERERHRCPGAQ